MAASDDLRSKAEDMLDEYARSLLALDHVHPGALGHARLQQRMENARTALLALIDCDDGKRHYHAIVLIQDELAELQADLRSSLKLKKRCLMAAALAIGVWAGTILLTSRPCTVTYPIEPIVQRS